MTLSATEFFSDIENKYIIWSRSEEKTEEIITKTEGVDIKIVFNKGRWIYPLPNCPIPAVIENTINITSSDNDKIKSVLENSLLKDEKCFSFPSCKYNKFEIRFFLNGSHLKNTLLREEKKYAPYESPRCGLRYECTII